MTSMFNRIARRATAIALASLATVCSAGPGDFDPTFGVAGVSQINCCAVIVSLQQSDGKLIVLGYTQTNHGFVFDPPLAKLIRLNSNGGIDTSFGTNGTVGSETPALNGVTPVAALIQTDGKILTVGNRFNGSFVELTRFSVNGVVDSSFGSVAVPMTIMTTATAAALQSDGKLLIAGTLTPGNQKTSGVVVRYLTDGQLDTSYGVNGSAFTGDVFPAQIELDLNGRVVVLGSDRLLRLLPNGAIDATFGSGGTVVISPDTFPTPAFTQTSSLSISPAGRILAALAPTASSNFILIRFLDNGSHDTSFGKSGIVTTLFDDTNGAKISAVALADGRTLAAGFVRDVAQCGEGGHGAVARFDVNGAPDTAFGNGSAQTPLTSGCGLMPQALTVQPDGKAVTTTTAQGFRLLADFAVDVIEFYNPALDHYFISSLQPDIQALDSGRISGWIRTGYTFKAYPAPTIGASPVCRFYLPPPFGDSHFYSASPTECAQVMQKFPGFIFESPNAMYVALPDLTTGACAAGTIPIYRLWDQRIDSNHRYTTDRAVRDQMLRLGWVLEGYGPVAPDLVIMCAPSS
jgi:uncharacterized delta-60 repeat protein